MFDASQAFIAAVAQNRPQRCLLRFSDAVFTNEDISIGNGGIHFHEPFCEETDLTVGQCPSASIDFTLFNTDHRLDDYGFGQFTASIGVQIASETFRNTYAVEAVIPAFNSFTVRNDGLYLNGMRCSVQPSGTVRTIVIDGSTIHCVLEDRNVWKATIGRTGMLQNPQVVNSNPFMAAKLAKWSGRGITLNGNTLTEIKSGVKTTWEYVPLGVFVAERPRANRKKTITVNANDLMQRFDEEAEGITYPITRGGLVRKLCEDSGVELATEMFPGSDRTIEKEPSGMGGATRKDILGWLAESSGSIARMGRDGKLQFAWFSQTERQLGPSDCTEYETAWYESRPVDHVVIRNYNSDNEAEAGSGNNGYLVENNPILRPTDKRGEAVDNTDADNIHARLSTAVPFHPATARTFADWAIQAGDVIAIQNDGETYTMPVYSVDMEWAGTPVTTLESTGNEKRKVIKPRPQRQSYGTSAAMYRQTKEESEKLETFIDQTDEYITLVAQAIAGAGTPEESIRQALLKITADGILSQVSDGHIISAINQTLESVKIKAKLIELEGYVTIDGIVDVMRDKDVFFGDVVASDIGCVGIQCDGQIYGETVVSSGIELANHYHEISADGNGKVTIGKPTDTEQSANFNIADTQFFRDRMAAEHEAGRDEVEIEDVYKIGIERWFDTNPMIIYASARAEADNGSFKVGTLEIDASKVYKFAWDKGFEAGGGSGSVTIESVGISGSVYDAEELKYDLTVFATTTTGQTVTDVVPLDVSRVYNSVYISKVMRDPNRNDGRDERIDTTHYRVYPYAEASNGFVRAYDVFTVDISGAYNEAKQHGADSVSIPESGIVLKSVTGGDRDSDGKYIINLNVEATASNGKSETRQIPHDQTNYVKGIANRAYTPSMLTVSGEEQESYNRNMLETSRTYTLRSAAVAPHGTFTYRNDSDSVQYIYYHVQNNSNNATTVYSGTNRRVVYTPSRLDI